MKGRFEYKDGEKWFRVARPVIKRRKEGEVTFEVSYRYNGGYIVNNHWVQGFLVGPPKIPKGFALRGFGVGLQLNAHPPYATMYLERKVKTADTIE